jgi:putative endonuclease
MLRCSDDSFYEGSTSYEDVATRVIEHNDARYAGYTSARRPVTLAWSKWFDNLADAHVLERQLKGWGRAKKAALIVGDLNSVSALARRRAGKPKSPRQSRRQFVQEMNSTGARHPEVRAAKRASPEG